MDPKQSPFLPYNQSTTKRQKRENPKGEVKAFNKYDELEKNREGGPEESRKVKDVREN